MARKDFTQQSDILIQDILLDTENARIRAGSDQRNCISRIIKKEKQILVLMEDIAKNGLTTMPILIMPTSFGKWIVKDGNRRITALKLLNNPESCPEPHLIKTIKRIAEENKDNIPSTVDCLSSSNESAVFKEIVARHSGARDGAGQYDWFAYMRTVFLLNNGHPTDYKRAGQYMCRAEKEGLDVEDDFPISTTARFFTIENLKLLGFEVKDDELTPILSKEKIIKMASRINDDFSKKIVDVNSVFKPEDAIEYLMKVRKSSGIVDEVKKENESCVDNNDEENNPQKADNFNESPSPQKTKTENKESQKTEGDVDSSSNNKSGRRGTPRTNPAERNKIFGRTKINLPIPEDGIKVRTIISELRQLDIKKTTLAVTVLLRALLELSAKEYSEINEIKKKDSLSKTIAACADHMLDKNFLNKDEHNMVISYTRGEQGLLHIETLQKYLHKDTHNPDYITINTFWDNIGCFVRACWKD